MLRNILKKFLFLIVGLLLVACASQKSVTPSGTADVNPGLNEATPDRKAIDPTAEKPVAAPLSPSVAIEKEVQPVKEAGTAIEPTAGSPGGPVPEKVSVALEVQFNTGKADIKPQYHNDIKRIADFLSKYPSMSVVIEGHTDNVGQKAVNVKLAYRRAANIKAYLVENFGIDGSRIKAIGYYYQKPVASNKTAEGRQRNRRGETRVETDASKNKSYSFFEDSDLPKAGFSIVNQETIDAKIKAFKEKRGVASYFAKVLPEPTLELYLMWNGVFSHCAIRSETNPGSFYQVELQSLTDLNKAGIKDYSKAGAVITLLGVTADQFDIVEFADKNERNKLDNKEPNYATMPICIDKKATRKSTQWYKDCLSRYVKSYNPEHALTSGNPTKVYDYNPPTHNCCNFAEEALEACGLAHCFDLGKSAGLNSKAGSLEE